MLGSYSSGAGCGINRMFVSTCGVNTFIQLVHIDCFVCVGAFKCDPRQVNMSHSLLRKRKSKRSKCFDVLQGSSGHRFSMGVTWDEVSFLGTR